MSTADILTELSRLTPAEREMVRIRLDDLDAMAPLSPEEKRLVDERVAAFRRSPESVVTWAVAEDAIRKQNGL
jgi:hypothetical protein